ncbi:MAG: hypothetical protein ACK4OP_02405 [Gemmobacter sp.]
MTRTVLLPALALLAACGTVRAAPEPLAAEIVRSVLVVHLTDGTRCVALTPFTTGTGRFANCPDLVWRVTADPKSNILRRIVEDGLGLLAADDLLRPFAVIEVTDPSGRVTAFASPPPDPTAVR